MHLPRFRTTALAAAALACAGAASAQAPSSVTLYGIVDVGIEHLSKVGAGGGLSRVPSTTSLVPSRWGLRGSEDLGGGLKALYTLEAGFAPDQGTAGQGGRAFGRQSWVGLGGSWGTVSLGRQYSMLFWSMLDSDVLGPAIYAMGSLDPYLPNARADNMLAWRGSFGGWALGAGYSLGRDAVNAGPSIVGTNCPGESAADSAACRQWSLYAKYDAPAWGLAAGYDRQNGRSLASATDTVFGGMTSSSKHDTRLHVGGYVKLAGAKLGAGLLRRDNDGDATRPRSDIWYLGASYPVTSALVLEGQYLALRYRDVDGYNANMLAARAVYNLSRRTAVYAQVGHIRNGRFSTVSVSGGAPGSATAPGGAQTGFNAGIRHSF